MDQEPEVDNGYVELVNAKEDENGSLAESPVRTNLWAWKHPHKAEGTVTYTRQEGGVVFDDVDFGITHIVRGEDHVTNTAAQIQMFEAIGTDGPQTFFCYSTPHFEYLDQFGQQLTSSLPTQFSMSILGACRCLLLLRSCCAQAILVYLS